MDKPKHFLGFRKEKRKGNIDSVTTIKLSTSLEDFPLGDDGASGEDEGKSTGAISSKETPAISKMDFSDVSDSFFQSMIGFYEVMHTAGLSYQLTKDVLINIFEDTEVTPIAESKEQLEDWVVYSLRAEAMPKITRHAQQLIRQIDHYPRFHNVFILGLVSQFDAYVGDLIRCLAHTKPHIVFQSERTYTAAEVFDFTDLDEFRASIIEKEVEAVLRSSHEEQFKWLESKIKKPLREGLKNWPDFIELCERINLFAHTDGVVSDTYVKKCQQVGYVTSRVAGDKLGARPEYLRKGVLVLLEIGVKLNQVLWRVSLDDPAEHEDADSQLNNFAYELIFHRMYKPAISLLEFGMSKPMKHPKKSYLNMMRINLANAYKLDGNVDKALEVLAAEDWLPMQEQFQICVAAVKDDLEEVKRLFPMVSEDKIAPSAYLQWPVFANLVKNDEYLNIIRQRFGNDVVSIYWKKSKEASLDGDPRGESS